MSLHSASIWWRSASPRKAAGAEPAAAPAPPRRRPGAPRSAGGRRTAVAASKKVDGIVEREEEPRLTSSTLDLADGEWARSTASCRSPEGRRAEPLSGGAPVGLGIRPGTRPGEEHLERQAARRVAAGPWLVGQALERQIGIRERRAQGAVRRRHQPLEGRIAGPPDAQRSGGSRAGRACPASPAGVRPAAPMTRSSAPL